MEKKIGIIGSGAVSMALAKGLTRHGYQVTVGTNDAEKHLSIKEATEDKVSIGTFAEVADAHDLLILAVKGSAAEEALRNAGLENFHNKIIIDTTNPIDDAPPVNGVIQFFTTPHESLMERLQRLVPDARFVKCYSCVGYVFMVDPDFGGQKPTMFICGNDQEAKNVVKGILDETGWETEDMGAVEAARAIEPLCILWCIPGFISNQWHHAFKLLRK